MVIAVAAVSPVACVGPNPATGSSEEPVGMVALALTNVPTDARCLRLSSDVAGRRTALLANLTPGAASFNTIFGGLPIGSQSVWADIFNTACTSVTSATVATWISDPVAVVTTTTGMPNITLIVRRPGSVGVGVDFCTTSPCNSCSAGSQLCNGTCVVLSSNANNCGTCGHSCLGDVCASGQCQATAVSGFNANPFNYPPEQASITSAGHTYSFGYAAPTTKPADQDPAIFKDGNVLCVWDTYSGINEEVAFDGLVADSQFVYGLLTGGPLGVFKCPINGTPRSVATTVTENPVAYSSYGLFDSGTAIYWAEISNGSTQVYRLVK